jgi:hypothetical protein
VREVRFVDVGFAPSTHKKHKNQENSDEIWEKRRGEEVKSRRGKEERE